MERVSVPKFGDIKKLVSNEAHGTRYYVHPRAEKMYHDLRTLYWWPNMNVEIVDYVNRCLTYSKVKAEHQWPSGLLQQPKLPDWKWEQIVMDFVTKLPKTTTGTTLYG